MIKKIFKRIIRKIKALFSGLFWYTRDFFNYINLVKQSGGSPPMYLFPQIFDKDPASHTFDKHYIYMDRWAARQIISARPTEHVDVGSSISFLSFVSAFVNLKFIDIRPIQTDFDNFKCQEGSVLNLPFADNSLESLSCLHVAEHIGLGRYGDPLDPEGTKKACVELARVLSKTGILYFALPVGRPAVYFNAHRVHDPLQILEYFSGLKLVSFAAVSDQGHFFSNADPAEFRSAAYACGMFKFTK